MILQLGSWGIRAEAILAEPAGGGIELSTGGVAICDLATYRCCCFEEAGAPILDLWVGDQDRRPDPTKSRYAVGALAS